MAEGTYHRLILKKPAKGIVLLSVFFMLDVTVFHFSRQIV